MELERRYGLDPDEVSFLAVSALAVTVVAQLTDPGSLLDLLIVSPAVLAFVFQGRLKRLPPELFAAIVTIPIVYVVGSRQVLEPMLFLTVTMVLYIAADVRSTARAAAIAAVVGLAPWVAAHWLAPEEDIGWQAWVMAHAFTFVLGRLIFRYKELIAQLDAARGALAAQAVAEERRRIARELHDLAGHTLAAMLLHVTGARHVLRRDLDDAERALEDAESVGRASLDQIRATVAALRTDERGTDPALVASADLDVAGRRVPARRDRDCDGDRPGRRRARRDRLVWRCTGSLERRWPTWPDTPQETMSNCAPTSSMVRCA